MATMIALQLILIYFTFGEQVLKAQGTWVEVDPQIQTIHSSNTKKQRKCSTSTINNDDYAMFPPQRAR